MIEPTNRIYNPQKQAGGLVGSFFFFTYQIMLPNTINEQLMLYPALETVLYKNIKYMLQKKLIMISPFTLFTFVIT